MAIKPNNQIVLLASEAEDIDAAYDSMEGQQDYVSIGGVEIPVGFDRSENTFYLLDDGEASRDALDKAKKLLKKFGGGQLKPTPNTKDNLAGKDYVAFADGNTYSVATYAEGYKQHESKKKISESKKNESTVNSNLIDKLDNMFHYHNKNLNQYQYGVIENLLNALKSSDSSKLKAASDELDNLVHYKNKNLNNSQYALLDEVLSELKSKTESKKNESTDTIKMGIDYTMFMRMCESAAFLDKDEDYWDALWEYYSGIGEIDDALVFFDNLFQYTSWKDVEETYDELPDEAKDDTKDKEEVIDAYLDENGEIRGNTVTKYGDHYLWVY